MLFRITFLLVLFFVGAFGLHAQDQPLPTVNRGNNHRTGIVEGSAIRQMPSIKWQVDFDAQDIGTPLIVGDDLYISVFDQPDSSTLFRLDVATGEIEWSQELGFIVVGGLAYSDNLLFMGTPTGFVAFNTATGEEQWRTSTRELIGAAPLVADGRVYIMGRSTVYALDAPSGESLWTYRGCAWIGYTVIEDSTFYFPCQDAIHAVDALTGDSLWTIELRGERIFGLAFADGILYTSGTAVIAVDTNTQSVLWEGLRREFIAPVVVADTLIYAGEIDNVMRGLDRATGEIVWSLETPDWAVNHAIMLEDVLYFGIGNHANENPGVRPFYALDGATGDILWTFEQEGMWISEPAFADGVLYVVSTSGTVYALEGDA